MDTKPDTIHISAFRREEAPASYADLFVTVKGSSVVSGDQAMKKAREVSALVDELVRFGIPANDIHLQGVQVETSSGTLLKSSSATYRLRVRCQKLDQIAEILDIISSQKNARLETINWRYHEEAIFERCLESAIAAAKAKAEKVAAALGVKLLGVYNFTENVMDNETPFLHRTRAMGVQSIAEGSPQRDDPSLGMDIQHSKTIQVNVEIEYRVSGF
jgi:uncharacterized protein YggE